MVSLPDVAAGAALGGDFEPAWLAFVDFAGDPARVTSGKSSLYFPPGMTGDPDLDDQTFVAPAGWPVSVGDIKNQEGGSDTLTVSMSGIVGPDTDLLNAIGNTANWRGRDFRMWAIVYDASGVQQGAVWHVVTGRMSAARIVGDPSAQELQLDVEGYLASTKDASQRTYHDQAQFDPGDISATLTKASANGFIKGAISTISAPTPASAYGRLDRDTFYDFVAGN